MPARTKASEHLDLLAAQRGGAFPPPDDLPAKGKQLWRDAMALHPGSFWQPAYLPLLRAYIDATLACARLDKEIAQEGEVIYTDKGMRFLNPRVLVRDRERVQVTKLATRLKISPDKITHASPADARARARGAALANAGAESIRDSDGLIPGAIQ